MSDPDDPFDVLTLEYGPPAVDQNGGACVPAMPAGALPGAATAQFAGFAVNGQPLVTALRELPGEVVAARTAVPLRGGQIGATLVVVFDGGDVRRPIIVGVLQDRLPQEEDVATVRVISVDGQDGRIVLSAEQEIVLRCGQASITLTRAGKVIIHGAYVSSRSSGVNRIRGGSVQIN